MTNKEAKHQVFMEVHAKWLANQAKHYGYNEWCGNHQDDLNQMICEDWTFTKANQKVWDTYNAYFEKGTIPHGMKKLAKKEIEDRLEKKMDKAVEAEFERYMKANY